MKQMSLFLFFAFGIFAASFGQKDSLLTQYYENLDTTDINEMLDIQKPPLFPGGETGLLRFLTQNIQYPLAALNENINGTVAVTFVVNKDGSISDATIVKDIGGGCGKEVLRVLKAMPLWIPGEADGKPVNVRFTLPVKFGEKSDVVRGRTKKKTELVSAEDLAKNRYRELDPAMCSRTYNPHGWDDNFLDQISSSEYFKNKPDSLDASPHQMPMFPNNGTKGLFIYFIENLAYPQEALFKKLSGRVVMAATIDEKGNVSEIQVVKSEHKCFSKAAKYVLQDFPQLYPGMKNGKFVPVKIYIPISFILN